MAVQRAVVSFVNGAFVKGIVAVLVLGAGVWPFLGEAAPRRGVSATVKSFSLVDAQSGKPIKGYSPIAPSSVINLSLLPTRALNIRANVLGRGVRSVRFTQNRRRLVADSTAPFTIVSARSLRRSGRVAQIWVAAPGNYTISAVPFSGTNGRGRKGTGLSLSFTVIDEFEVDLLAPPIPQRALWESNMITYGRVHCNPAAIAAAQTWEGGVWYYDGMRVYHQIAEYTKDPSWLQCAEYVRAVYRGYVLANKGMVPGRRVFAHGLYLDLLRTGDSASGSAVRLLATRSAYAYNAGSKDFNLSRETAHLISAFIIAEKVGQPLPANLAKAVGFALGHLDAWTVSKTASYIQPYLVGLTMEALIDYYERTRDVRIVPAIRRAADFLWDTQWLSETRSFRYLSCKPGARYAECATEQGKNAADLNLLIAPAFAWLYRRTGDQRYLLRGDAIFEGGVLGTDFLSGGKQFTQNYRWSFDYVRWRLGKRPVE